MGLLKLACVFALVIGAGSVSFAQEAKKSLTVMQGLSTPDFGYLPTYLARAKSFSADEALDLKVVVMRAPVSVTALITGEIQFAVAGPSITAALKGAPLKAIFFTYKTSTLQFAVRPEIRAPEDLKGKAIAILSPGATHDQVTRLMLKKLGLDPVSDVRLVAIGDSKARVIAMEAGQIAGSANNPDVAAQLVRRGYRILTNSSDVYPIPFSGIAVNHQLIRKNPEVIRRWLRAHLRAMLFIRQYPDDAAQVAAREFRLDIEVAREAIRQALGFMSADDPGGFTEKGMRLHLQYTARLLGVDPEKVAISQVADLNFLREAQRQMGIYCREGYLCK